MGLINNAPSVTQFTGHFLSVYYINLQERVNHTYIFKASFIHSFMKLHNALKRRIRNIYIKSCYSYTRLIVQLRVEPLAEGNVVPKGGVLYPGLLGHVRHAPQHVRHAARPLHLTQQGRQQGGLPAPHLEDIREGE